MKVIVTGGAGFIGSHLVDALIARGAEVHCIDNLSTGSADRINTNAVFHELDIRSEACSDLIVSLQPDTLFHLAAQVDVQKSVASPAYDADVNMNGTVQLLTACRQLPQCRIVFASTSAVYGNLARPRIRETDPTAPISYYGLSKLSAERYIQLFHHLYSMPYTILRYANVYGPRQTAKGEGGVVAIFKRQAESGSPLRIFGDGEQTRDFIFVGDVVQANLAAMSSARNGIYHVSTAQRTSVNALYRKTQQLLGRELPLEYAPERPGDIKHSCLDNAKASKQLGWTPRTTLLDGLKTLFHSS